MKHYLKSGQVFAFEADGSQDHLITGDMQPLTPEEVAGVLVQTPEQIAAAEEAAALSELREIDAASVRSMREFILAKFAGDPLLPTYLSDHEAEAVTARGRLS